MHSPASPRLAAPKHGARFSFAFPGSVQGFRSDIGDPSHVQAVAWRMSPAHGSDNGRSLAIHFHGLAPGRVARAATRTFFDQEVFTMRTYKLHVSPTLYAGPGRRTARCSRWIEQWSGPRAHLRKLLWRRGSDRTALRLVHGARARLGRRVALAHPPTGGRPVYEIGVELEGTGPHAAAGTVYLDYIRWGGSPDVVFRRPEAPGEMWTHAWVNDASHFQTRWEALRVSHDDGLGMIIQGTREWRDYEVSSELAPLLAKSWGLGARVQGRRRFYAVMFDEASPADGTTRARLVRWRDTPTTLATCDFAWEVDRTYDVRLRVKDLEITASVGGVTILKAHDDSLDALDGGGIALLVDTGSMSTQSVTVRPV